MPCPFPGMDPYIERPEIWPDFHDRFITFLCGQLQPLLRPRYVALTQDRLYVVESERPIRPDVSIVRSRSPQRPSGSSVAVLEPDKPVVFELQREEVREPLLTIVEPAGGNRIVTAIEVLSPDNKSQGAGRVAYLRKREEFWSGGTNVVEVDLLRDGERTVRASTPRLETLRPWSYMVVVTRQSPSQEELYAITIQQRLSRIAVPLAENDRDVPLDLQAAFVRRWEEGPYPELLRYDGPPPGTLTAEELSWCEGRLRDAGLRPPTPQAS